MLGRVVKLTDEYITLEVANNTEVVIQRAAVGIKLEKGTMKSL